MMMSSDQPISEEVTPVFERPDPTELTGHGHFNQYRLVATRLNDTKKLDMKGEFEARLQFLGRNVGAWSFAIKY
jgi:hypothetical protein